MTVLAAAAALATAVGAQEPDVVRRAYLNAVAGFFELPASEVLILGDWGIAADEIPAVLFVARHAGVSPEALAQLRRSGRSWGDLTQRYGIGAPTLHVPIRDQAPTGALSSAYERYRQTPVSDWRGIRLSDDDVVALVNVRVIAQALGVSAEEVVRRTGSVSSYVELFALLSR